MAKNYFFPKIEYEYALRPQLENGLRRCFSPGSFAVFERSGFAACIFCGGFAAPPPTARPVRTNSSILYMHFLYGEMAKEVPDNFAPPEAWEEFGTLMYPPEICAREDVQGGIRWSLWPLTFEQYISDAEPDLEKSKTGKLARNRVIAWRRIRAESPKPNDWMQFSKKSWRIDGYHKLESGDYLSVWNKNARRDARLWRDTLGELYNVEEIPFEEFKAAYLKSTVAKKFGTSLLEVLERKMELPQVSAQIKLWGARNIKTGQIIAGTA